MKTMDHSKTISIFDSGSDSSMQSYKNSIDNLQKILSSYGLTANQSKVYIYLGKYGSKTAPQVCRTLKLPRTETYHLLTSLQNKGIVEATYEHPTQFNALPLDKTIWTLVNTQKERVKDLEREEKNIMELWKEIPDFHNQDEDKKEKFQMLEGSNQIYSKIAEMWDNTKQEIFILGSEKDFLKFYHADLLEPLIKSKLDYKLLASCSENTMYIFDDLDRNKIRKLNPDIHDSLCFIMSDESEILFFMKNASQATPQTLSAMWTDSSSMIYSKSLLFNNMWSESKRIHL